MAEEKSPLNANAISPPVHGNLSSIDQAKKNWMDRLEKDIDAAEESEKAYTKKEQLLLAGIPAIAAAYEKVQADPARLQLKHSHAKSYQKLRHTLLEGRTKFLQIGQSVATLVQDYQARIQMLEKQTTQHQEEMHDLKEKQQKLIKDSLALFVRHKNQLEELLRQLAGIPSIKKEHLQNLFDDANEQVEKLEKENTNKPPNFELCNTYLVTAGKMYQNCYASIIQLIGPQSKQDNSAIVNTHDASIGIAGMSVAAGGDIHVGPNTTINHNIIYQTAEKELKGMIEAQMKEMIEAQKQFYEIKAQHDVLQQNYQKKEEELSYNKEALKHQQEGFSQREQEFFEQAAEQARKTEIAMQEAENSRIEAEQIKKQMQAMQQRIAQLEAESATKTVRIERAITENQVEEQSEKSVIVKQEAEQEISLKITAETNALKNRDHYVREAARQALIALINHPCFTEPLFKKILNTAIVILQNEDAAIRAAPLKIFTALAGSSYCNEEHFRQLFTAAITALQDKNQIVKEAARQALSTLAGNLHCTEQQVVELLTLATSDPRTLTVLANNPHCIERYFEQLLAIATTALQDENQYTRRTALRTLTTLAVDLRFTEQHFAQLIMAITDALKDKDWNLRETAQQVFLTLAKNSCCTELKFTQLFTVAITILEDESWYARQTALKIFSVLISNVHCTEPQFAQMLTVANAALENEKNAHVQQAGLEALTVLVDNRYCTESQFAQLFVIVAIALKDKDEGIRQAAQQTLITLASNIYCTNEQLFTQLLITAAAALKGEDQPARKSALQTLAALIGNPCITEPQSTQVLSVITTALKDEDLRAQEANEQTLPVLADNSHDTEQKISRVLAYWTNKKMWAGPPPYKHKILYDLVVNWRCTEPQFTQLIAAIITIFREITEAYHNTEQIWHALVYNPHCTEQQCVQLFFASIDVLKNQTKTQRFWSMSYAVAKKRCCTEQQCFQLFSVAMDALKDQNWYVRDSAMEILIALAANPYYADEQVFTQLFVAATAALKNENEKWEVRQTALKTLVTLAGNPHCSTQQITRIHPAIIYSLKDVSLQEGAKKELLSLVKNCSLDSLSRYIVLTNTLMRDSNNYIQLTVTSLLDIIRVHQRYKSLLASHSTALQNKTKLEDNNERNWRALKLKPVLTPLAALEDSLYLSSKRVAEIHSSIISNLECLFWREHTKNSLIQLIKECLPDQLPSYTNLANTLLKNADTYIQLTAIFMLMTIQQRCQNELEPHSTALETKAEFKDEEVLVNQAAAAQNAVIPKDQVKATAQSTPAEAATVIGLMPKPKEHVSGDNLEHAAAALTTQFQVNR